MNSIVASFSIAKDKKEKLNPAECKKNRFQAARNQHVFILSCWGKWRKSGRKWQITPDVENKPAPTMVNRCRDSRGACVYHNIHNRTNLHAQPIKALQKLYDTKTSRHEYNNKRPLEQDKAKMPHATASVCVYSCVHTRVCVCMHESMSACQTEWMH